MPAEWTPYSCVIPPDEERGTVKLESVYHVTHASTALRIIEDGEISQGLVYDESKLNVTRHTVVWVSPNTWYDGSRYGTVQFEFDWKSLAQDRMIYWVESVDRYRPSAVRFFVARSEMRGIELFRKYDPVSDDGPLRLIDGVWWRNRAYTLELMVDRDLLLSECRRIAFIEHHSRFCNIGASRCGELGKNGDEASARVLSYLLTTRRAAVNHAFLRPEGGLTHTVDRGISNICFQLGYLSGFKGGIGDGEQAEAVVQGALSALALDRKHEARQLASLLASERVLFAVLNRLCRELFSVDCSWLPN